MVRRVALITVPIDSNDPRELLRAFVRMAAPKGEDEGLAAGRPGLGTFVTRTLVAPSPAGADALRRDLGRWVARARAAGFDDETMVGTLRGILSSNEQEGVSGTPPSCTRVESDTATNGR